MLIENKNGFVDLRNIPKRGVFYFWKESIGCVIPFRYLDVVGELKIVNYVIEDKKLIVGYEGHNYELIPSVLIRGF